MTAHDDDDDDDVELSQTAAAACVECSCTPSVVTNSLDTVY